MSRVTLNQTHLLRLVMEDSQPPGLWCEQTHDGQYKAWGFVPRAPKISVFTTFSP